MKKVKMTPGEAIAITLGIWAVGFLLLTILYRIFVTVRGDIDGSNDQSVANGRDGDFVYEDSGLKLR